MGWSGDEMENGDGAGAVWGWDGAFVGLVRGLVWGELGVN